MVTRAAGLARARFDDTVESGVYRLTLPDPPGGFVYATVAPQDRGSDAPAPLEVPDALRRLKTDRGSDAPAPLEPAEASKLAEGWPLTFEPDPARLPDRMRASGGLATRRELWRGLVLVALAGLCVEIYLTRRLVRGQGPNLPSPTGD